jgi:hypothetical protein
MSRDSFDLFALLGQLNKRDMNAFTNLTEEGQKAASPLVIMRWLSGTSDPAQIVRLNEFVNRYVFSLGQEKPLLFKLMAAACTGKNRATWLKGPTSTNTRLAIEAVKTRYECSAREAKGYIELLEPSAIVQFAEEAGWDKEQLKKLELELGREDGSRSTPKSGRKSKG